MSKSFELKRAGNIKYITIERINEGFEYSLFKKVLRTKYFNSSQSQTTNNKSYNKYTYEDILVVDDGIIENPRLSYKEALKEILKIHNLPLNTRYIELDKEIKAIGHFLLI